MASPLRMAINDHNLYRKQLPEKKVSPEEKRHRWLMVKPIFVCSFESV